MDPTKIPKPFIRPPCKIPRSGTSAKMLPEIPEASTLASSSSKNAAAVPQPRFFRRRSKSVSDLKTLQSKALTTHVKPLKTIIDKPAPVKTVTTGHKRPALQKSDENSKPKVAKIKIPDWDYKSRFQELLKKYTSLQEEMKDTKSRLLNLPKLEEEVQALQTENRMKNEKLEVLKKSEKSLLLEKEELLKENHTIKNHLSKQEEAYSNLKNSHEILESESEQNLKKLHVLEETTRQSTLHIANLENERDRLEKLSQELKESLEEHENLRRYLHNTIQDMKGNIRVFCRVRPPVNSDENDKLMCSIFFPSETNLEIRKCRESVSTTSGKAVDLRQDFTFDKVFPPEAKQTEVFEELSQLVQSALDGYHVCVFAYGQTGSGKTYTMQGSANDSGMIPRTIDLIFEKIQKLTLSDWTYTVRASFLEIYNENIRDLLVPQSTHNYELRYNEGRGVTVTNLKIVPIASAKELRDLMEEAHKNRAVAATDFNEHSSRSHAVTKIHLEGYNKMSNATYCGSVNLVDLAGSESAKTSSAERITETKSINKSLLVLGSVMLALHNKDPHVPYRNSKLTFLLQSCLGGNSKTLMFVNISPFEECFNESINSLRFASKVKEIKMTAKRNKIYCSMPSLQAKT